MDETRIETIERMIVICDERNEFVWNLTTNDVLFVESKRCRFPRRRPLFDDDLGDFTLAAPRRIEILAHVGASVRIEL